MDYSATRKKFDHEVARHLGVAFKHSMSIEEDAARWLSRRCIEQQPTTIVEFGAGFSTLVFASYLRSRSGGSLISLDHSHSWLKFMESKADGVSVTWNTVDQFIGMGKWPVAGPVLAFVDSGPTYAQRCEHAIFAAGLVRASGGGLLVLDDYQTVNCKRRRMYSDIIEPRLRAIGIELTPATEVATPGSTRILAWARL